MYLQHVLVSNKQPRMTYGCIS